MYRRIVKIMIKKPIERLMTLAQQSGLLRPRDLAAQGIARTYLQLAVQQGLLKKVRRGVYSLPEAPITEHRTLIEVCTRVPRGVLCLLTALRFHEIGTQNPPDIWLAIGTKDHKPVLHHPRLQIVRFSGKALTEGIEEHTVGNTVIRVTNPAKTVADCFKYRNKIGLDVALEALKEVWRHRRCTANELQKYAEICRVSKVMRPYMEAILA